MKTATTTTNAPVADREGGQQGDYGGQTMPWHGEQPIEKHAKTFRGRQWVPLEAAIAALQFWQERDWLHEQAALRQTLPIHGEMREALEALAFEVRCNREPNSSPLHQALARADRVLARNALQGDGL